jgi:hypothetical protein
MIRAEFVEFVDVNGWQHTLAVTQIADLINHNDAKYSLVLIGEGFFNLTKDEYLKIRKVL